MQDTIEGLVACKGPWRFESSRADESPAVLMHLRDSAQR